MEKGNKRPRDIKLAYRVSYLIAGHIKNSLTDSEQVELNAWVQESSHNKELFAELTDKKKIDQLLKDYDKSDHEDYLEKSKESLVFRRNRRNLRIWTYAAAAIAAVIILLLFFKPFSSSDRIPGNTEFVANDIKSGSNQAILILANGQKLNLSSTTKDTVINHELTIHAAEGELTYNNSSGTENEYHTLTIPRKGFYKLKLPDGTRVWLNSESSIRYPTTFTGNERRVMVTGETYFEVVHNAQQPFRVEVNNMVIEDIGTSFNINAYENESAINTSLIEGSIKISKNGLHDTILKPGEEAQLANNSIKVIPFNTDDAIAWKNGQFKFVNTSLEAIMRQISRWYDAEIIYKDHPDVQLNATIEREVPVSKLLHLLSKTDEVHFKIEGTKIIVTK